MSNLIYCFVDVEVDGPSPGANSMLAFACVACDVSGNEIGTFECNLTLLETAESEPETMEWWKSQPEAWAYIRDDPTPPETAMPDFCRWLDTLTGDLVLAAHPLIFDGLWLDWYLREFTSSRVFRGPFQGRCRFTGAGIDIPSYVQAALGQPYFRTRPDYPTDFLNGIPHTHNPIDDARGHAALYFNARERQNAGGKA